MSTVARRDVLSGLTGLKCPHVLTRWDDTEEAERCAMCGTLRPRRALA
jgi:hypothetical protein